MLALQFKFEIILFFLILVHLLIPMNAHFTSQRFAAIICVVCNLPTICLFDFLYAASTTYFFVLGVHLCTAFVLQ